ncbi:26S proteasome non-ATPase regulatory subunit, partial [Spiromyces aspiralis]
MTKDEQAAKDVKVDEVPPKALVSPAEELERALGFISAASRTKELSYVQRTIRTIPYLRRHLPAATLLKAISAIKTKDNTLSKLKALLEQAVAETVGQDNMEVEGEETAEPAVEFKSSYEQEALLFLTILALVGLLDRKDFQKGQALSQEILSTVNDVNGPVMDPIMARIYYYYSFFHEVTDKLDAIRPNLLNLLTMSSIKLDYETQATVLNLLLRNYIHYKLYDQAQKLVLRSPFPETASNAQLARYMYYVGLIKALRLDYTEAHKYVEDCIRKVPTNDHTCGFQQAATKLLVVIELLLGQIPKRSLFKQQYLKKALVPYLALTQAVRVGELVQFQRVVETYRDKFEKDGLYALILRLHHNVIRAGIRSICQAYSAISFKDISIKLDLNSEEDAQYIVAKAIRDGVIDAVINYKENCI